VLADSGLVRPLLLSPAGEDGASRAPWVVGVRADRAG